MKKTLSLLALLSALAFADQNNTSTDQNNTRVDADTTLETNATVANDSNLSDTNATQDANKSLPDDAGVLLKIKKQLGKPTYNFVGDK